MKAKILLTITFIFFIFSIFAYNSQAEQVLTIAQGMAIQTLDPHASTAKGDMNITTAICETLTLMDYSKMEIVPNLANSWRTLDDTTWEVKLRQNVKFTNGEPFDANSVKYSIERIKDPKLNLKATFYVKRIKEVKVIDSHTIHFVTDGPTQIIPLYMSEIAIVPSKYTEETGQVGFSRKPVGTGPFQLVKWVKDEYVELESNSNYWRGKAKLDRVIFKSIPESLTRMAALKTKEADLVTNVLIEEIPSIKKAKDLEISTIPSLRNMFVQFNMIKESPILDKRVRQAMNYGVDVSSIIKNVLNGYGTKLNGQILSKDYEGYNPNLKPYPYDPEKARRLIKEAGYENYEFTLMASTGRYLRDKEVAEVIGGQLNAAGVKTKVRIMEWGGFLEKIWAKELFNMGLWGGTTVPTAEVFLGGMVRSGAAFSICVNPEFDKLFDEAVKILDKEKRRKLFYKIGELLHDDPPFIYLYTEMNVYGVNKRVGGWKPIPDERIDLYSIYIK
jgi:peptide/nickel transport system substrate-binding protein